MQQYDDYFVYGPNKKHHNPGKMKYKFEDYIINSIPREIVEKNEIKHDYASKDKVPEFIEKPKREIVEKNEIKHDYASKDKVPEFTEKPKRQIVEKNEIKHDYAHNFVKKNLSQESDETNNCENIRSKNINLHDIFEKSVDCVPKLKDTGSNTDIIDTGTKEVDCVPKLKNTGSNTDIIDTDTKEVDCVPKLKDTGSNTDIIDTGTKEVDCVPKLKDTGSNTDIIDTDTKRVDSDDEYYDAIDTKDAPEKKNPKTKNKRKNIPKGIKNIVWKNQYGEDLSGPCIICKSIIQINNFEASHIISHANGGSDLVDNLRPLCSDCNRSMHKKNWPDYINQYIEKK